MTTPPLEPAATLARAGRGLLWSGAGTLGQVALRLAAYAWLARTVAPESFGAFAAALVALELVEALAVLSLNRVLIAEPTLEPEALQVATTYMALVGLVLGAGIVAAREWLEMSLQVNGLAEVLRWVGWIPALSCASMGPRALLQRELRFRRLAILDLAGHLAFVSLAVPLAWGGGQVHALVAGLFAQVVVRSAGLCASAVTAMRPRWHPRTLGRLLRVGGLLSIESLSSLLLRKADRLIVGRVFGAGPLGVYDRAASLVERALQLVLPSYSKVLFATTARVQDSRRELEKVLGISLEFSAALTLPVACCLSLLSSEVVAILLGPGWEAASSVLLVLAWTLFTVNGMAIASNVLVASGHTLIAVVGSVAAAVVVLGLVLIGTRAGPDGVALGVLVGTLAGMVGLVAAAGRSIRASPGAVAGRFVAPALGAMAVLVAGGLARGALSFSPGGPALRVLVVMTAVSVTLAALAWWAPRRVLGAATRAVLARALRARGLSVPRALDDGDPP